MIYLFSCTDGSSTLLCFSCSQVERSGDVMAPPLNLIVSFPHLSPLKNKILDLTHFSASSGVCTHTRTYTLHNLNKPSRSCLHLTVLQVKCNEARWMNWDKSNPSVKALKPKKETLSVFLLVSDELCFPRTAEIVLFVSH